MLNIFGNLQLIWDVLFWEITEIRHKSCSINQQSVEVSSASAMKFNCRALSTPISTSSFRADWKLD